MKQTFQIEELESIVAPTALVDVLDSLWFGGFLKGYQLDYRGGFVTLELADGLEVEQMFKNLQNNGHSKD